MKNVIHICTSSNGGISSVVNGYVKYFGLPRENYWISHSGNFIFSIFRTIMICFKILFDSHKIYHLHIANKGSVLRKFIISIFIRFRKKKYIFHWHNGYFKKMFLTSNLERKLTENLLKYSCAIICITKEMKVFLAENMQIKNNVFIIHNFCETILEKPIDLEKHRNTVKIVFFGRYVFDKGIYDLLVAFERASFEVPVQLDFYGYGEIEKVKEIVGNSTKKNSININGWIEHSEFLKKLQNYDFFVLPSYVEAFPVSILEAMGFGIPIISTHIGGVPEMIENGKTGILFEAGNINELTDALEKLTANKNLRIEFGKNAWITATEKFSPKIILKKLEDIYEKV